MLNAVRVDWNECIRSGSQSCRTCRYRCSTFSYTGGLYTAMRSMANLLIVSFTTSPINQSINQSINHRISQSAYFQPINQPIRPSFTTGVFHLGVGCNFIISFGRKGGGRGHSKVMPCVHNLPLPGKRHEDTRAVIVETDNNNNNNIQKSSGK